MELFELQQKMVQKDIPHFLIFVGSDYALANLYVEMLTKKLQMIKRVTDDIQTVFAESVGNALNFEDKVFVMRYPKDIVSKEEIWTKISDKLNDNILVMIFNDLDKRTKFYTQNKDIIVNFAPQDDKTFVNMVKSSTKMSVENVKSLGKICGNNYGKFLTEFDKIKNYSDAQRISQDEAFKHLLTRGVIYTGNKDVTFDFINKVMDAKKDMYEPYMTLKLQGESNMKLISLLYTAMRNQFICQTVKEVTAAATGLQPFVIGMCKRRLGIFKEGELRNALRLLQRMEQGIKMGIYDEVFVIDYFLAQFLL